MGETVVMEGSRGEDGRGSTSGSPPGSRTELAGRPHKAGNASFMPSLITVSRFTDPDAAYALLAAAHRGCDAAASAALNARLVLILANHIGDIDVLREAIALAEAGTASPPLSPPP
jgi:hypothetical protein